MVDLIVLTIPPARHYQSGTVCPLCAFPIYPYGGVDLGPRNWRKGG